MIFPHKELRNIAVYTNCSQKVSPLAEPPKSRGKSPGWPKGRVRTPTPHFPVVRKPKLVPKKLRLMGFCVGGHMIYVVAARYSDLGAVVPFYGSRYDPTPEGVERVNAPVLTFYGSRDESISMLFFSNYSTLAFCVIPVTLHVQN